MSAFYIPEIPPSDPFYLPGPSGRVCKVPRPEPNARPTTPVPPHIPQRDPATLPLFQGSPPESNP